MNRELNTIEKATWNRQIARMELENKKLEKELEILNINLGTQDDAEDGYAYCVFLDEIARFRGEVSKNKEKIRLNETIIEEGKKQLTEGVEIKEDKENVNS